MVYPEIIRTRYAPLSTHLHKRARWLFAASEARAAGYGGVAAVSQATGIAASTIGRGLKELGSIAPLDAERIRRPGGGRKALTATDASLLDDLLALGSGKSSAAHRSERLSQTLTVKICTYAASGPTCWRSDNGATRCRGSLSD